LKEVLVKRLPTILKIEYRLMLSIKNLQAKIGDKQILNGINLEVKGR
jgi:hypothetical protein